MTNAARDFAPWLGVFETLRVVNGVPRAFVFKRQKVEAVGVQLELEGQPRA